MGNRQILDALLEKHLAWIQSQVRRRLGPSLRQKLESWDIVQDAALELLNYGPRCVISDENQFRAVLARIVENVIKDKHDWFTARRRAISQERPLPSDSVLMLEPGKGEDGMPSTSAWCMEERALIRVGMELLEPEDRKVLLLRQWQYRSFSEIGEQLGLSANAAWIRHKRAVVRLARKVGGLRRGEVDLRDGDNGP